MTHPARKLLPVVFLLAAAFLPHRLLAGAGEWTTSGPRGGSILNLAADPSNPSILYAATDRQIYKSVDGGQTWSFTLFGRFDTLLPTSDPSVVYATGVYQPTVSVTADGGGHWVGHLTPLANPMVALAVGSQDPRTLYALVLLSPSISSLYRSTNGAESWELIPNPPASGVGLTGIAVDPADPTVLYVSAASLPRTSGVYRSSNGGASWTQTALQEPSGHVVVDPKNPSRVFALTGAGVQVSTNGGASWRRIFPGSALQFPTLLAVDPVNSSRLYAMSSGALFSSSDGGATVTRSPEDEFGGLVQAIMVSSSGAVFAGSRTGIYRSEDAAASWGGANGGISEIRVTSLAVDPTDPAVVFAGSPQGIHESRDGSASWNRPTSTSPWAQVVAIDPTDHSTLYAAGNGVQKSTDGGRTWGNPSPGLADLIYDLVIDPNNPRRLLASSWRVSRSSDGAQSWHQVLQPDETYSSYYYPPTINAVAIAPSDSSTLYSGGQGFSPDDYHSIGLFYRSGDGGDHWTAMASAGSAIGAIAVDFCDPGIVQAAGDNTVYRSTDGGSSWSQKPFPWDSSLAPGLASGTVFALVRDPRHSSSIFAGTSEGVFWSNDRGVTWTRFEPALRESVLSIALDSSGRFLYAGTEKGVFGIERSFAPCATGADRLCLLGGKYEASLTARRPGTAVPFPGRAIAEADRFGYFSFPDVTGDPTFPEVFVKMVDATNAPPPYGGSAWVFNSSLTDLDYTLTVRETETGRVRIYSAPRSGSLTCGEADTSAFARACEVRAASTAPEAEASFGSGTGAELSLLGGRFRATVRATDPRTGRVVEGVAYPREDRFGYFGLAGLTGDPAFPEIFVKMADGRQDGGHFWVFHTGLTDLSYELTIRDTVTGAVKTYPGGATNGTQLCGAADTSAF